MRERAPGKRAVKLHPQNIQDMLEAEEAGQDGSSDESDFDWAAQNANRLRHEVPPGCWSSPCAALMSACPFSLSDVTLDPQGTSLSSATDSSSESASDDSGADEEDEEEEEKSSSMAAEDELQAMPRAAVGYASGRQLCCVCLSSESSIADDELLQCARCYILVHVGCYGNDPLPGESEEEGSEDGESWWFCEPCKALEVAPVCSLCPIDGGAFKQVNCSV